MTFVAADHLSDGGAEVLQPGWHVMEITEVIQKTSSKGNFYAAITLSAPGGKSWLNLNIDHPNPKADEIARRELAHLMVAVGCNSVRDPMCPDELVGKSCKVLLEQDGDWLRAKQFKPLETVQAVPAAPAPSDIPPIQDDDIPF